MNTMMSSSHYPELKKMGGGTVLVDSATKEMKGKKVFLNNKISDIKLQ